MGTTILSIRSMKASILTIGTELLIGQTIDTNSAWLGSQLSKLGITILKTISIADDEETIIASLEDLVKASDLVYITGGLGPTKDDITKSALAKFLEVDMYFDDNQYEHIQAFFRGLGRDISPLHKAQCHFPVGTQFLDNALGTAPGMQFQHRDTIITSMPGVPYEMKSIFKANILPQLQQDSESLSYHEVTMHSAGLPESAIAERIQPILDNLPSSIDTAYLPSMGIVKIRMSTNVKADLEALETAVKTIVDTLEPHVYGYNGKSIASAVLDILEEKSLRLGIAESCTGGYLTHLITSIPGCSRQYTGTIIAYDNTVKVSELDVDQNLLDQHGAVSKEAVRAMVTGACHTLNTDVAISISGIAGPTGGTAEKPVGTVWISVGNSQKQLTRKFRLKKDRLLNIRYASNAALIMLRKFLLDL